MKITNEFKNFGLDKYSILEKQEIGDTGKYRIIRWFNPAFILKDVSNIILGNKKLPDDLYYYSDAVYKTVGEVIPLVFGVYDGHIPMSYVVLATSANY